MRELLRCLNALVLCPLIFVGCAGHIFSPETLHGVDRNFDFARWRLLPNQTQPTRIELGGRILRSQSINASVVILTAQLPIVRYPAYGPKQGKSQGEFVITYHGPVNEPFLHPGNRIMVVGTTHGTTLFSVDDVIRNFPSLEAQCIHIWKTGTTDIADFTSSGAGYAVLEEETFCTLDPDVQ